MSKVKDISAAEIASLYSQLSPLVGTQLRQLALPVVALAAIEPSQVGTIVGSLMDALLPHLPDISDVPNVGLIKAAGVLGEREGYPDYLHKSGYRLELKLLYVDNPNLKMKRPPTIREASARITQKVTVKNVEPATDVMLLVAYMLQPQSDAPEAASPTIIDLALFPMIELVGARDKRLLDCGGRWFGDYETPAILSKLGKAKVQQGKLPNARGYGRKESEGRDYNEDTNFGKLKRVPHAGLQAFLKKHRLGTGSVEPCEVDE